MCQFESIRAHAELTELKRAKTQLYCPATSYLDPSLVFTVFAIPLLYQRSERPGSKQERQAISR